MNKGGLGDDADPPSALRAAARRAPPRPTAMEEIDGILVLALKQAGVDAAVLPADGTLNDVGTELLVNAAVRAFGLPPRAPRADQLSLPGGPIAPSRAARAI